MAHRLLGECQRLLEVGSDGQAEATFTRLLFQQTSFNCGNRPFRLVIHILKATPRSSIEASRIADPHASASGVIGGGQGELVDGMLSQHDSMTPLACLCSCPVHIDARKRSKGERPEARDDDVRLVQRQRPTASKQQLQHGGGLATWFGNLASLAQSNPSRQPEQAPPLPLMDAAGDAFVEVRSDGVVVRVLSSVAFGYGASQLLGRSFLTIVHPDDHAGFLQTLQAMLMLVSGSHKQPSASLRSSESAKDPSMPPLPPQSLRVLHRIMVGMGSATIPKAVAVDSIISVAESPHTASATPTSTLYVCSRTALPIAADPVNAFSFRVCSSAPSAKACVLEF